MYEGENVRALHAAVKAGNLQGVRKLLAWTNVDAEDAYKVRPVHIAAELGHLDILKALIARGCNVNAQAPWPTTKCQDMDESLSQFYSTVGGIATYIENPLASMLSTGFSFVSYIETKIGFLETPLEMAARKGHLSIVKALVSAHADVNAAKNFGETTPLIVAVKWKHEEIARFLLQNGAVVNARNSNRATALHYTASNGDLNITKLLIQNKAAVNAKTHQGSTPLHVAIENRQAAISECLINSGADVNARDNEGCTPLLMSTQGGYQTETARLLIAKGAEVNAKNGILRTPLYYAAENNYTDIVNLLIENKADVNVTDDRKWTPLHGAAHAGNLDIIKILIASAAEVDPLSHKKATPLHLAADSWHLEVVKYLLEKGAEVNAPDHRNWTPLHFAANEDSTQVPPKKAGHSRPSAQVRDSKLNTIRALVENGAHVNAKGSDGETAVYLAKKVCDGIAATFLLKNGAYDDPMPQSQDTCTLS